MREEFKKTTPWVFTGRGSVIRYDYGFTCFPANAGPYFSITGEEWRARRGEVPQPAGRDCLSCGCLHDDIPKALAFLRPALPFHLFDPNHGPMHYIENGLFRIHQITGETPYMPKEYDPDPWKCFLSHVCYGVLADDGKESLSLLQRNLCDISDDGRKLWLTNRLPALTAAFQQMVTSLDLTTEYNQAIEQYKGK